MDFPCKNVFALLLSSWNCVFCYWHFLKSSIFKAFKALFTKILPGNSGNIVYLKLQATAGILILKEWKKNPVHHINLNLFKVWNIYLFFNLLIFLRETFIDNLFRFHKVINYRLKKFSLLRDINICIKASSGGVKWWLN